MSRKLQLALPLLFLFVLLVAGSEARIIIVPPQPPYPPPRPIPPPVRQISISEYAVEVAIDRQVAHVEVRQNFKNETGRELEGTFIFPLPPDAQVSEFTLVADGKRLEGEVLDKDEARRIYESIVRRKRDPALLEYLDHKLFRARVYPIPPKSERSLEFSYDQILKAESGLVEFFFPLGHETREVYLDKFDFELDIQSDIPIKTVYSPTYDVDIERVGQSKARLELGHRPAELDQDFVLYYSLSRKDMDLTLLTYRRPEDDGFFLALLTPDPNLGEDSGLAKDFIFVLDTSGSMKGEKIGQARQALQFCLESLESRDRFNIITFESDVDHFYPRLVKASSDNLSDAKDFTRSIKARGGTNIEGALGQALQMVDNDGRPTQIVFLTDGLPTVGEQNIKKILKNAERENPDRARVFSFGVGYDVNTHLLDLLAEQNHGASDYVRPGEDIEVKVSRLYEKISRPVLTDVDLAFDLRVYDLYPPNLTDLFAGSQLIIIGRYRDSGWKAMTLTGESNSEEHEWIYEAEFPTKNWDNDYIPRLWASRKIGFLMDEVRLHGENPELIADIVALSEEYGIITPYTSYLVREERDLSRWDQDRDRRHSRAADQLRSSIKGESGREAVESSLTAKKLRSFTSSFDANDMVNPSAGASPAPSSAYEYADDMTQSRIEGEKKTPLLKRSATRTYYLTDGIWVDSKHSNKNTVIIIKPFSQAYFELLKEVPGLKSDFAVGDKLVIAFDDVSVQLDEDGAEELSKSDRSLLRL